MLAPSAFTLARAGQGNIEGYVVDVHRVAWRTYEGGCMKNMHRDVYSLKIMIYRKYIYVFLRYIEGKIENMYRDK